MIRNISRRLVGVVTLLMVGSVGIAIPSQAVVDYKTCYVETPEKLSASMVFGVNLAWSDLKFTGDCPSNEIPAAEFEIIAPLGGDGGSVATSYTSNNQVINYSAAQIALQSQDSLRWSQKGLAVPANEYLSFVGQTAAGYDTYEVMLDIRGCFSFDCGSDYDSGATPIVTFVDDQLTGKNALNLNERANYKFIPANNINAKFKTSLVTTVKRSKGTNYLTLKIAMDRKWDPTRLGSKIVKGDKATIKRGNRVIARVKFNKLGKAKVRVLDIAGSNKYTVSVPEVAYSWAATSKFVK